VARSAPGVLAAPAAARATLGALRSVGLADKAVRALVSKEPRALAAAAADVLAVRALLCDDAGDVRLPEKLFAPLLKRAPWLLHRGAGADGGDRARWAGSARFLRHDLALPVDRMVAAYPEVLDRSPAELRAVCDALSRDARLQDDEVPKVAAAFPLVFGLDPATRIKPAVMFMHRELGAFPPPRRAAPLRPRSRSRPALPTPPPSPPGIDRDDVARVLRAFPSLLGLEPETHFMPVVNFLRDTGVLNIGRFVQRYPPVLAMDVATNLRPKMEWLLGTEGAPFRGRDNGPLGLKLQLYELLRFPALLSYPIDAVVAPRVAFLLSRGASDALLRGQIKLVVTPGDEDFAKAVAGVQVNEYRAFKTQYVEEDVGAAPATTALPLSAPSAHYCCCYCCCYYYYLLPTTY